MIIMMVILIIMTIIIIVLADGKLVFANTLFCTYAYLRNDGKFPQGLFNSTSFISFCFSYLLVDGLNRASQLAATQTGAITE